MLLVRRQSQHVVALPLPLPLSLSPLPPPHTKQQQWSCLEVGDRSAVDAGRGSERGSDWNSGLAAELNNFP